MKKICVITGTRAEFGLLRPLLKRINDDNEMELKLIVTGMHLSPEFGLTYKEIEQEGFKIEEKIEILLSSDSEVAISKAMGLAMISFSECFARIQPDMIIVLGDRYEIFSAVSTASIARIPISHIHGGEITEGAFDDAFRHAITKMSYLHFTSTESYRKRVIQLGENPNRVFNVGAIGIESIKNLKLLTLKELEESINFKFGPRTALITFHPVTLENKTSKIQFQVLLDALNKIQNLKLIFTKANSDTNGRIINTMIDEYVEKNSDKAIGFTSLGQLRYLSAIKYVDMVIGNSSSGIIEAPAFKVPTINIGDRQKGRLQPASVLNCNPAEEEIIRVINIALSKEFKNKIQNAKSPYGEGTVSEKIISEIKKYLDSQIDVKKGFFDI
jgi:GDP/UDP-N,N'-diacetylbacillosamine 2-epimerase (hydrolysing)